MGKNGTKYGPLLDIFRVITTSDITLKLAHITSQMDKGTCKVAMLTEKAQNSSN